MREDWLSTPTKIRFRLNVEGEIEMLFKGCSKASASGVQELATVPADAIEMKVLDWGVQRRLVGDWSMSNPWEAAED